MLTPRTGLDDLLLSGGDSGTTWSGEAEDAVAATEEQNATVADPAATAEADALEDVCEQMKKTRMS